MGSPFQIDGFNQGRDDKDRKRDLPIVELDIEITIHMVLSTTEFKRAR